MFASRCQKGECCQAYNHNQAQCVTTLNIKNINEWKADQRTDAIEHYKFPNAFFYQRCALIDYKYIFKHDHQKKELCLGIISSRSAVPTENIASIDDHKNKNC